MTAPCFDERTCKMKTYHEPSRDIPVLDDIDVLVVGGGPAGFAAAVCSARRGARTLLVEQSGEIGGVATTGLMSHWTGNTRGGFYEELLDRSRDSDNPALRQSINPEKLKTVMLQMLEESGSKLQLYTFVSGALVENDVLKGVITESKSGRKALLATVTVDATGDGDVAAKSGVPYVIGRESDGAMQPMTLMFKVGGVDLGRAVLPGSFETNPSIPAGPIQNVGKKVLPFPAGHVLLYRSTLPGIVTCNMTNCLQVNGCSAEDLTHATIVCRSQIKPIVAFLRKYVPGFEKCYVISSASMIGVRETRHFKGEKVLTEQDILSARFSDDWVVENAHFGFDVHNMSGNGLDATGEQEKFPQRKTYVIPYGCLVPLKIDNLLLAGRDISGTHLAHSSYRVMPICANMGQAAGIAAALCAADGITPRQLDPHRIQRIIKADEASAKHGQSKQLIKEKQHPIF